MLRLFQVNEGRYIDLEGELTPNSRVGDVCEGLSYVEGGGRGGVVLMVADGRQMEHSDLVATYSAGMESKPIFVFYQSYISSPSPPSLSTHLKPRPELERAMGVLSQKPYPGLFQKLPQIAKLLSDYSSGLFNTYLTVGEECELQIAGWNAVQRNCKHIIGVYKKHQQHFTKVVINFQSSRPHYQQLVNSFPEQVKLLHKLPVPSSPTPSLTASLSSSLYDWISTHDEKNSLIDLCSECEKALAQVEDRQLTAAIENSQKLMESFCKLDGLVFEQEVVGEKGKKGGKGGADKAEEIAQLQMRMTENIHSTSQRAMRSGDGGTVADLTVSHHKSLQLMRQQNRQLEDLVRDAETRKAKITQHIHKGLHVVTELQMKINESNSVLVFLHETLKLAKKRFEVLDQVCSCGEVLGNIVSEVERRELFDQLFTERVVSVAEELRSVREDEKQRRHTFTSTHRHHFLLSLFPQLTHRLPDAMCRLSRVPDTTDTTDLSEIKKSLPPHFIPPVSTTDSLSLLFSRSNILTSSTPQITTTSPLPPTLTHSHNTSLHGHRVNLEKEVGLSLAEPVQGEEDEDRAKLVRKVRELEERLTAMTDERDILTRQARERETQNDEIERERVKAIEEREMKIQQLQTQLVSISNERNHLKEEMDSCRQESETNRETVDELTEAFEQAEKTVTDQKLALSESAKEIEAVNEARMKLNDECKQLSDCLEKTKTKVADLEQQNMQWRQESLEREQKNNELMDKIETLNKESEKKGVMIESLGKTNTELIHEVEMLNNRCQSLSSDIEQLRSGLSDNRSIDSSEIHTQTEHSDKNSIEEKKKVEIAKLTAENEALKKEIGTKLSSFQYETQSVKESHESQMTGLMQHSNQLESQVRAEMEQRCGELQLQRETEKTKFTSEIAKLNSTNEQLHSQSHDLRLRSEELDSQLNHLKSEHEKLNLHTEQLRLENGQLTMNVEQFEMTCSQLRQENQQLRIEKDTISHNLDELRQTLEDKKESGCVECENHLKEIEALRKILEEKKDELKRSDYRHQQAQIAFINAKAQQEQLRVRLMAQGDNERMVSSRVGGELGLQGSDKGRERGGSGKDGGGGDVSGEEDDGWVLEGEGRDPRDEVKRLQMELAVERSNRSLLADELQEVGRERDEYMQRFMEVERELRSHHHSSSGGVTAEPVMTASSSSVGDDDEGSSSGGSSCKKSSVASSKHQQKRINLTISNLQVNDLALFCVDSFNNYLALCVDGKTYYLNQSCVPKFTDTWQEKFKPTFKRKLLIGRVTKRLHVEVRKEDNRLHVPVGTRLYKLEAVELTQDSAG